MTQEQPERAEPDQSKPAPLVTYQTIRKENNNMEKQYFNAEAFIKRAEAGTGMEPDERAREIVRAWAGIVNAAYKAGYEDGKKEGGGND